MTAQLLYRSHVHHPLPLVLSNCVVDVQSLLYSGYGKYYITLFNEGETLIYYWQCFWTHFSVVNHPVEVIRWGLSNNWKTLPSGGHSNVMKRAFAVFSGSINTVGLYLTQVPFQVLMAAVKTSYTDRIGSIFCTSSYLFIYSYLLWEQHISLKASSVLLLSEHFLSGWLQIIPRSLKLAYPNDNHGPNPKHHHHL